MRKEKRLNIIKELVSENEIKTQDQLVGMLLDKGLDVTQATISRDIRTLKLIKVPAITNGFKYSFVVENEHYSLNRLQKNVRDSLVSIEAINYFVLLKTFPGHAHSFGALLDALHLDGKAGTVSGNDTCLIICRTKEAAASVEQTISDLRS